MNHPESLGSQALEPSVGDLLRFRAFQDGVEKLTERNLPELKQLLELLGRQVFVAHPASVRWLVGEAAKNLQRSTGNWVGEELLEQLGQDMDLPCPPESVVAEQGQQ